MLVRKEDCVCCIDSWRQRRWQTSQHNMLALSIPQQGHGHPMPLSMPAPATKLLKACKALKRYSLRAEKQPDTWNNWASRYDREEHEQTVICLSVEIALEHFLSRNLVFLWALCMA